MAMCTRAKGLNKQLFSLLLCLEEKWNQELTTDERPMFLPGIFMNNNVHNEQLDKNTELKKMD